MTYANEKQWSGNINGATVKACLSAYYPAPGINGGYNDCLGYSLDTTICTCASPPEVPVGTLVRFTGTGTDIDGKIYRVNDRGGDIKIGNCPSGACGSGVYRFDILMKDGATANSFGRKHNVTAQFGEVVDRDGNLVSSGVGIGGTTQTISGPAPIFTTTSFKTNPETDFLLSPTDDERKYGINIYEGEQPLIKFSTYSAITSHGGPTGALKKYAEFLYYLLNSEVTTAQINCIGMPWIRPGFNVWYDPMYSDAIYYCIGVQHQGEPINGGTTVLTLVLGRDRKAFIQDSERFGSFKNKSDNVFISEMKDEYRVASFGKCLNYPEIYDSIRNAAEKYYGSLSYETADAKDSQYHKNLYVDGADSSPVPPHVNKNKIFTGQYTKEKIKKQLSALYSEAPETVKARSSQLKSSLNGAKEYINKYNLLEKHKS